MSLSNFVARCLAIIYLSAGVAALSGRITFSKIIEDFEKSPALTYISGFMAVVIGMILITFHNVWVKNWTTVITIIAWISLIKGIMLIAFPRFISLFKDMYKNNFIWGLVMIILGLAFGYLGFFT
jgi:predicted MFS family arabinose efflux permease